MNKASERLRIAVAGAGKIGRRHIELINGNPACQLAAVVDPSEAADAIACSEVVPLYRDLAELFSCEQLDGVILATPNQWHVQNALDCIHAGVAALIEKPVAHTVEAGVRLLEAAEASTAKLLVGHHRAHSPILKRAREVIASGVLGELVMVMGSALFYKPDDYFDSAAWRRMPGGGPILINMIHEIGSLRSLCGEIVAVQALASNARRGFAVEDTVTISLRFANGALGSFALSDTAAAARSWEQTSQENLDYPSYSDEDCYLVTGTQGSLAIPTMRLKTYPDVQSRSWMQPFDCSESRVDRADPLAMQLDHFCSVIRGEVRPLVTVRDGLQNLRVTEAIAVAARTGGIIDVDTLA